MAKWFFQKHDGYNDIDQSSSAEAFSGSAIRDLSTALIREGVQNVLDARAAADVDGPVRVRLTLGTCAGDSHELNERWFNELMDHLRRPEVGAPNAPARHEVCSYLAFEDFGTQGLVGDYKAPFKPGAENNFVNFMYHDGVTGKPDAKLGSRGVGKVVFTMASRARTVFAYTIRANDTKRQPLLVGKNLLKFREVNGELYAGRSYFLDGWLDGRARQPVTGDDTLNQFRSDFPITRNSEPGLSIVVPFIDPTVTAAQLRRAIVEEYHYALLSGQLDIELNDHGIVEHFSTAHVPEIEDPEVNASVALARWAVKNEPSEFRTLPPTPQELQRLTESLVPEVVRDAVGLALNRHERIAVRMPLYIHPKSDSPVLAEFDVYLEFAERHQAKPVFIRELLPVSDVREAKPAPTVRAMVLIRAGPLADLLRAAEGANHTDWSPRTERFLERYKGRLGEISFVAQAVSKLVEIVRGQANEPVGGIATQFFSAFIPKAKPESTSKGKIKPGPEPDEVPNDLETPAGASYILNKTEDGFTIKHKPGRVIACRLTVRVAYDVLRGSAWSDYDPADFDFRKPRGEVRVIASDADVARKDPGNRMVIVPDNEAFEVVVTGFDPNRDLIVDVRDTSRSDQKRKENQSADPTDQLHEPEAADA